MFDTLSYLHQNKQNDLLIYLNTPKKHLFRLCLN
jgi:hypothetical protein